MDTPTTQTNTHSPLITDIADADAFATEVKQAPGYVLVDMWADWCGPCHMLAPHLDKVATRLAGKLKIVKVDTEINQSTAIEYQILSLPTMLLFKDGTPVAQAVGFRPEASIMQWLEEKGVDIS